MLWKDKKIELEKLIFDEKVSYEAIGRLYGVTGAAVKKAAKKLGLNLPVRQVFPKGFVPANKGKKYSISSKNPIKCFICGEICNTGKKYCSNKCQGKHRSELKYKDFLENNDSYCRVNYCLQNIKPHILKEQNNKCVICSMLNTWNGKALTFVLDHIDGDAANNKRVNLRLICHNCDSQLDTYKSKNKNSARKERYLKQYTFLRRDL